MTGRPKARGARSPLTGPKQDLARRYIPLARSMAKPYKATWPGSKEDFDGAACLALVEAAEAFDPSRNVLFSTFARHRIWGALRDVQRAMAPLGWRSDPGQAPLVGPLHEEIECRDGRVLGVARESPVGEAFEGVDAVEALLRKLPPRHAAACRQIYLYGKTQVEAAKALGLSQSRLSCMHSEAIAILDGSWAAAILSGDTPSR